MTFIFLKKSPALCWKLFPHGWDGAAVLVFAPNPCKCKVIWGLSIPSSVVTWSTKAAPFSLPFLSWGSQAQVCSGTHFCLTHLSNSRSSNLIKMRTQCRSTLIISETSTGCSPYSWKGRFCGLQESALLSNSGKSSLNKSYPLVSIDRTFREQLWVKLDELDTFWNCIFLTWTLWKFRQQNQRYLNFRTD